LRLDILTVDVRLIYEYALINSTYNIDLLGADSSDHSS